MSAATLLQKFFISLCSLAALCCMPSHAQSDAELKSAYLYRFVQYVWWSEEKSTIKVAIVGANQSTSPVYSDLNGRAIGQRTIALSHVTQEQLADTSEAYDVIYVAAADSDFLRNSAHIKGALVVADETLQSTSDNIVIQLVKVGTKLRFEINQTAAANAGIELSARLIGVAHKVHGVGGKEDASSSFEAFSVHYQLAYNSP